MSKQVSREKGFEMNVFVQVELKEEGSLLDDIEVWVDKKTWMMLKMVSGSGDVAIMMAYTKFEPNAKIEDDIFVLDLPEDFVI